MAGNPPEDRAFVKARSLKIGDVLANPEHGEILNVKRAGDRGRIGLETVEGAKIAYKPDSLVAIRKRESQ